MDEPFGAVDPLNRAKLQNEFLKIQKQLKKTVIFVTHDIEEAMKMGDKIAIMSKGKLAGFGTPEEIITSENEFVKKFMGTESYIKILGRFAVEDYMKPEIQQNLPHSIGIGTDLRNALASMVEYGTRALTVFKEEKAVGTIYLEDIVNIFQKGQ